MLEIALANSLDKTWVPFLFMWSFEAFRCHSIIVLPWFKNCKFFSRHFSFNFWFISAALLWYWSVFAVIPDIETLQLLLSLMVNLTIFSTICSGFFLVGTSSNMENDMNGHFSQCYLCVILHTYNLFTRKAFT